MGRNEIVADLVRLRPAPGAIRVAVRAASTVLVALTVLSVLGRLDLALYATFGAFASVYGGGVPYVRRWRLQAGTGLVLVAAVGLGAVVGVSTSREWLAVPVTAVVAGARHYGLALVFITCLALLIGQLATAQPVLSDRLLETTIGVVVGVVGAVLTRARRPVG